MKGLFRWPLRSSAKVVTYSFRLAVMCGEATTAQERRTYPFEVVFEKSLPPERLHKAVRIRSEEIAADMAEVIEAEVLAGIADALATRPPL